MKKYIFRKYSKLYPKYFKQEKNRLVKVLGKLVKIEHVGSTAVPSLGGKGILDLVVGVGVKEIKKYQNKLIKLGYEFCPDAGDKNRLFFKRDVKRLGKIRRIHLHLTKHQSQNWREMIDFRNFMLGNKSALEQYIKIKKQAVVVAKGDGEKYRKYKEKFIQSILKKSTSPVPVNKLINTNK